MDIYEDKKEIQKNLIIIFQKLISQMFIYLF